MEFGEFDGLSAQSRCTACPGRSNCKKKIDAGACDKQRGKGCTSKGARNPIANMKQADAWIDANRSQGSGCSSFVRQPAGTHEMVAACA
jgi:hypothetical protein